MVTRFQFLIVAFLYSVLSVFGISQNHGSRCIQWLGVNKITIREYKKHGKLTGRWFLFCPEGSSLAVDSLVSYFNLKSTFEKSRNPEDITFETKEELAIAFYEYAKRHDFKMVFNTYSCNSNDSESLATQSIEKAFNSAMSGSAVIPSRALTFRLKNPWWI